MKGNLVKAGVALGGLAMHFVGGKPSTDRELRLESLLKECSYGYSTAPYIQRADAELAREFPQLRCELLKYQENGVRKCFIQYKGLLPVGFNGAKYSIQTHVMLPQNYPTQPPLIRIVNIDPSKYKADGFYDHMRSATDPTSYLINDLEALKHWGAMTSLTSVIKELQKLLSVVFPFRKFPKEGQQPTRPNEYAPVSNWTQPNQQMPQYGSYPSVASNGSRVKQPPIPFNPLQQPSTQPPQQQPPQQFNKQASGTKGSTARQSLMNYSRTSQEFVEKTQAMLSTLRDSHLKNFQKCQRLSLTNKCLKEENQEMINRNQELSKFVKEHESCEQIDLSQLVVPQNHQSQQILELLSEKQALDDSVNFLEAQFSSDKLPFDQFMKIMRKTEQDRFTCRKLIKRVISLHS